jgi:hypothetical protein
MRLLILYCCFRFDVKEQEADDSEEGDDEVNGNDEEESEYGDGEEGRPDVVCAERANEKCLECTVSR